MTASGVRSAPQVSIRSLSPAIGSDNTVEPVCPKAVQETSDGIVNDDNTVEERRFSRWDRHLATAPLHSAGIYSSAQASIRATKPAASPRSKGQASLYS